MLFRKKPAEERSPQELEIALQEAEMPQKGLKPFLHKNGKKLVAVLVIAAILVVLLVPKGQKKAVNAETAYTQVTPENRDITNVYSESGVLHAANSYTVKATVKGDVLTADFEVGDVVEKGAVLYTIDSSDVVSGVEKAELNLGQAQRSYDDAVDAQYIRTDIAGTVASFKVRVGDVVNAGQEVATIRDDTTLLLELEFPAADAANFAVGQSAEVLLDSTFEAITGSVQSVSGADTLSSGNLLVRTVTIAVRNTGNLTASQAATATINGVSALSSARFSYQREQSVTAQNSGTVSALCVKEGAQVSADTALLHFFLEPSVNQYADGIIRFTPTETSPIWTLLDLMIEEYAEPTEQTQGLLKALFRSMAIYMAQELPSQHLAGEKQTVADQVTAYIELHSDTASLKSTAAHFGYHPVYISRLLSKKTGKNFSQTLLEFRMKKAAILLKSTDLSIEKIAAMLGYSNNSNFYKAFREYYGTSPKARFR